MHVPGSDLHDGDRYDDDDDNNDDYVDNDDDDDLTQPYREKRSLVHFQTGLVLEYPPTLLRQTWEIGKFLAPSHKWWEFSGDQPC